MENYPEGFALHNNQEHKSGHLLQELFHGNSCIHMNPLYYGTFPFFHFSQPDPAKRFKIIFKIFKKVLEQLERKIS